MLQAIRDKAQGWIAWAIVILITIPFALWGIQEYLGVGGDTVVAEVEGMEIGEQALEEQTRRLRDDLRANLGSSYRAELFSEPMLRRQALDRMIDEQVLRATAEDWQMRASDQMVVDTIRSERAFQVDGRFDHELYRTVLSNNALSESAYEASIRQGVTLDQLQSGVVGSAFATAAQLADYQRLADQQRTLSYAVIAKDAYRAETPPDDQAVADYFERNRDRYQVPERVRLDYLVLDIDSLARQIPAREEDVRAWYADHKHAFVAPEERRLRHILIAPEGDDDAAAADQAQALYERLASGADFAELARTHSADPVSGAEGGDLGWVSRGMMVAPFEEAAFALETGVISEPVRSEFGYHLIQVQEVRGGGQASFDQVADKVTAAYRKAEAERLFFEHAERLAELSYEVPDNLEHAAEALGLTIQHSGWLDRSGGQGDLASPKVVAAAFSDDVMVQGHNSELLELAQEKLLVLRVAEHQVARAQTLDEVREQVAEAVRREQAMAAAKAAGEQALAAAAEGTPLQAQASEAGWEFHAHVTVDRNSSELPAALRELAFGMPRPAAGGQRAGAVLADGDYGVLVLEQVQDGDPAKLDEATRQLLQDRMAALSGRMEFGSLARALRDRADVEVMLRSTSETAE